MRHCYLAFESNFKRFYANVSSVGPVSGVHALALVHDIAGIHAIESVSSVVCPTVTSVHALVFTHALAGTHVFACVSEVVGSLFLALLHYECCSMMSLLLLFFPSPCRKSLRKEAFCILQCREILVPGARQGLPPEARLLWHGGM